MGSAWRKARLAIAPVVQEHLTVLGKQWHRVVDGFPEDGAAGNCLLISHDGPFHHWWGLRTKKGAAAGPVWNAKRYVRLHLDAQPGPSIAALVDLVVNQAGVSPDRRTKSGGTQIGFGGDRVLAVAEVVADVGQRLDERNANVRRMPLLPARRQQ